MDSFKERLAREAAKLKEQAQVLAEKAAQNEQLQKLKAQAAAAAETAKEKLGEAKEKVAASPQLEAARNSFSNLSSIMKAGEEAGHNDAGSSDDHNEDDRLMDGSPIKIEKMKAGLSALGSKLGQIGAAGKAKLDQSLDTARQAGAGVAQAGASVAHKGAAGIDKLKSSAADAKGRAGEALSAASAMTGVSVPGQKVEKGPCDLTYKQRLIGCAVCLTVGLVLSIFSLGSIAKLILGNPAPFAFKYTFGNILSLGATSFLVGPKAQFKGMLQPSRRLASLVYITTLIMTLYVVFRFKSALLCLLLIIIQFCALTWLTLSYIPYGQSMAKKIIRRILRRQGILSEEKHAASAARPAEEV